MLSFHQLVKINTRPDLLYCMQLWVLCAHLFYMSLLLRLLKLHKGLLSEELRMGSSGEVRMNHNHNILNKACSTKGQLQTVEEETYLGNQGASR